MATTYIQGNSGGGSGSDITLTGSAGIDVGTAPNYQLTLDFEQPEVEPGSGITVVETIGPDGQNVFTVGLNPDVRTQILSSDGSVNINESGTLAGGRVYWAHLWQHQPEPTPAAFAPQASSGR